MNFPSPIGWLTGLLSWFGAVFVFLSALLAGGCAPQATELERFSDRVFVEVIGPAVQKAIAETSTRTATLQGGAQVIEPGYSIDVEGFWGTGVKASTVVRVRGVSGQLTGHAQADQGQPATVPPPATREESTELPGPGG
jgi:hypothetical protein